LDRNAFFWQIQDGKIPAPKAVEMLGMNILNVEPESGCLEVEFEGKEAFANPTGNIQGGFLAADTMGPCLSATLGDGEFAPTISMNVQFLSSAKPGKLIGSGRVDKRGKEVCYLIATLEQNHQVVATATATAIICKL